MGVLEGSFFVTGTDTDVGKTFVSELLIRGLRALGRDIVGMKPICCGDRGDAERLQAASGESVPLNLVNPVWLRTPAAPYTAAMIENRMLDLDLVREGFSRLRSAHKQVLVEGAGGWQVPITRDYFMSDLAAEMGLPVIVVVANRLGALNHAFLTIDAIRAKGLICAGLVLNHVQAPVADIATPTNRAMLETLRDVPVLFEVAYGQTSLDLGL